ncbi:hypothetical protein X759_27015 [Mesorhizobium sp. LSHC420B00]|nr:hypothetical protein X759_27015 [Mesorhizobium sp. LSHC420B00]
MACEAYSLHRANIGRRRSTIFASFVSLQWDNFFAIITGQIYRHEFDRTKSHAVIFTPEALQSCREKLIYKYNKMINIAIARKILFVYTTL